MYAGLASMLFVVMLSDTVVKSQIQKGPANALKKVGDSVILECVTRSNNCDQVEWVKMEGAQSPKTVYRDGIILNGFPSERYSVSSTAGCNLTMKQLNISDSGRFSCVLQVDDREETRGSVLIVIEYVGLTEACLTNVTSSALNQNDSYSFWTSINVPAKSVEPSNVTLSYQNKIVGETETTDDQQPTTIVRAALTGIARKVNITQHVCRASLLPTTTANFDGTTATLDVCTTQQLMVSYSVENIAVSPGPYYKDSRVTCTADGYPSPTFKWTNLKSGNVVNGDTLMITGEAGDKYNCIAMNIIKGRDETQSVTIEVSSDPSCGSGCSASIIIIIMFIIIIAVVIFLVGWKLGLWPLRFRLPYFSKKDDKPSKEVKAGEPLPDIMPINEPADPPSANDPAKNRPRSECTYAELQFEPKPQQIKPNIVNDSSTDYACVAIA